MFELTARFDLDLQPYGPERPLVGFLQLMRSADRPAMVRADIGDYSVSARLLSEGAGGLKNPLDAAPRSWVTRIQLDVRKREDDEPPADDFRRHSYFFIRREAYQAVAAEAFNRIIAYFRFGLNNPNTRGLELRRLITDVPGFDPPMWLDNSGQELRTGQPLGRRLFNIPGVRLLGSDAFGARRLSEGDDGALEATLSHPLEVGLHEELLAEGRDAAFQGNLRRAVLETAIACEVMVREFFFPAGSPASAALEALRPVGISDLIQKGAQAWAGTGFLDAHPEDYQRIELLMRCRNQAAHKGAVIYRRKDREPMRELDFDTLAEWWNAVRKLEAWLTQLAPKGASEPT